MTQLVRINHAPADEITAALSRAGVPIVESVGGGQRLGALPEESFLVEVDVNDEIDAAERVRETVKPWGCPLEPLGPRPQTL